MSLAWHPHKQPLAHPAVTVSEGLLYVDGAAGGPPAEPSAVILQAEVAARADAPGADLPAPPSYELMTPGQRRAYLEWQANGRRDKRPEDRARGYLWLYLYGLERRIFLDQDMDVAVRDELLALVKHYGSAMRSRALRSRMLSLFHAGAWRMGPDWYRSLWPEVLVVDDGKTGSDEMQLVLANLFDRDEAMDWTIGFRLAMADENTRRSVVVKRVGKEFWDLFQKRYEEMYPEGLRLTPAKQDFVYRYRPASPVLHVTATYGKKSPYRLQASNILGRHSQFKRIFKLWDGCVEDLSGYSRQVISPAPDAAGLKKWLSLPGVLRKGTSNPMQRYWDWMPLGAPKEGEVTFVTVKGLARWFGMEEKTVLSRSQSMELAEGLSTMGWNVVPHPSHVDLSYAWNQEVALLKRSQERALEPQIPALVRLMYLMIPVASADGNVDDQELEVFRRLTAQEIYVERDGEYLKALEKLLMRDASVALRALPALARRVKPGNRPAVLRLLVHVAASDGEVTPAELKLLQRVARTFGMPEDAPLDLLANDDAFRGVVVPGGASPRPAGAPMPETDRIALLTLRTREAVAMLSEASLNESNGEPEAATSTSAGDDGWLAGLSARFRPLVAHVSQKDEVALEDFEKLAHRHGLTIEEAFAVVNAWADTQLGDALLEMSDPVRVYRNLLPGQ